MKICMHTFWEITPDFIGGTERFIIELCKELQVLGFQPFVVCTGSNARLRIQDVDVFGVIPDDYKEAYAKFGDAKPDLLRHLFLKDDLSSGLREFSTYIKSQISEFSFDVLHLNSFASSVFTDTQYPTIVTNHENSAESDNLWGISSFSKLKNATKETGSAFHNHSALVVPSHYYARKYSEFFDTNIVGINQGVSITDFCVERGKRDIKSGDGFRVLLPSRIEPFQKGHDLAIKACKRLVERGVDVQMTFSGLRNDNLRSVGIVRSMAADHGVLDRIEFTAYSDMRSAYREADLVISPERYCSYGLSVSEALAVGKPTVLSDIPTYKEIASGYEHAYFFESESSDSLADSIQSAIAEIDTQHNGDVIKFRCKYDFRECAKKYAAKYISAKLGDA